MQNADMPQRNTISNEMKVNLDVFGALMLDWIRGHVDNTDIVTEDDGSTAQRSVKLLEKLAEPTGFSDGVGDSPILRFSAGAGDCMLSLGRPRDEVIAKKHTIAGGGATSVRTARPVRIRIGDEAIRGRRSELQSMVKRALDVPKNSLNQQQVLITWVVHVEAYLMHGISDVWSSERQILEGSSKTPVL